MPEPDFPQRVKDLAGDRKMSVAQVGYQAYDPDTRGTNPDTFKSVMVGRRAVTPVLIEAVARVLEVPPEEFPEYRLAVARAELDEREVGLDQALENLELFRAAKRARDGGGGVPPIRGETGRQVRALRPSQTGRKQPGSGQGKANP